MCTVSYIKLDNGFVLTSNRDETVSRPTLPPAKYSVQGKYLVFPKDEIAEGSWIACNESGQVSCLLNGASEKHKHDPPYDRSRGKVLLESFTYPSITNFVDQVNLRKVEPFTLILANNDLLIQLQWDGTSKVVKNLNNKGNHLWSSATLYPKDVAQKKEQWFSAWTNKYSSDSQKNILKFHQTTHGNKPSKDVRSQFKGDLKTVSITQVKNIDGGISMDYHDLISDKFNYLDFE